MRFAAALARFPIGLPVARFLALTLRFAAPVIRSAFTLRLAVLEAVAVKAAAFATAALALGLIFRSGFGTGDFLMSSLRTTALALILPLSTAMSLKARLPP
jgi:hypothetical protein